MGSPHYKKAKLKIVGGDLPGSSLQDLDPTIHYLFINILKYMYTFIMSI